MRSWIITTVLVFAEGLGPVAASPRDDVVREARLFLNAYARGDTAAVLAKVDPEIAVYGSDIAEVFHGVNGVKRMLADDRKLWRGAAAIGEMTQMSVVSSKDLSALTFQAPFSLAGQAPVQVRFSMVWRRESGGWRLLQSANSAPTVGQSAEALLAPAR